MSETENKKHIEKILTKRGITAAYFSTSGNVENKVWHHMQQPESMTKEDSGVFLGSSDEDPDSRKSDDFQTPTPISGEDLNCENIILKIEQQTTQLTEITLLKSQSSFRGMKIVKFDDRLSIISEKSAETDSQVPFVRDIHMEQKVIVKTKQIQHPPGTKTKSPERQKSVSRKLSAKRTRRRVKLFQSPNRNVNLDIPQLYQRQNTTELLHLYDEQIPVARASVNRKISNVRNNMFGNNLRDSTKKLQNDLRQTMRKYSTEKSQLLRQLSSLRYQQNQLGDLKLSALSPSTMSESSSVQSSSRYYMAPNIAAHKLNKKKKKTQETKITAIPESSRKEGILKLPVLRQESLSKTLKSRCPSKTTSEWDSGRNNSMQNLPPLHPPPGIAAAKELLQESYKIPKVRDSTRHDITRASLPSRTSKKKVHFAEKHSVSEYGRNEHVDNDFTSPKNYSWSGDTKSLPPISNMDTFSVDSITAYSALPPIYGKNCDTDPNEVIKATQQYKSLYLKMKDPEQRMKTLAEILYSVRLRMIENEQTLKYGINPKHMKNANTLCDFLMNRNHNSSMSMYSVNSELSTTDGRKSGIPSNTAARSGRKSGSLQLQNYLRKMSRSRRPSEEIRMSRMMAQPDIIEGQEV
ncbi:uncharacterized protein LOC143083463 [Mytilus galloprovincialis]|uniref:uncharacterized protein LOC143083463 n=1 Tax=Mytilus galloprovincialis TaxID=29158 RepID=UPI003F7CBEBA